MKLAITGVSGYLGRLVVSVLETETAVDQIVGLGITPPGFSSTKLSFTLMDARSANLAGLLENAEFDTMLHLAWIFNPSHNSQLMYDVNVNGTRNVLAACRQAGIKHVVIPGSTTCYGAHADNPDWLEEDRPLLGNPGFSYSHHKVLVERFCDEFEKDNPQIVLTRLRACIVLGGGMDNFIRETLMMRGLRHAAVMGHNPHIQFLHEADLTSLLRQVVIERPRGIYNATPDDSITIAQVAEITRNPIINYPYWLIHPITALLWSLRLLPVPPSYLPFIKYRWTASNARIKAKLGWRPRYSSREALAAVPGIDLEPGQAKN